jgi:hypothetical protein
VIAIAHQRLSTTAWASYAAQPGEKPMSQGEQEAIEAKRERVKSQPKTRKPYAKPRIVHELELETRAGSSLSPGLDIPGLEQPDN